MLFSVQCTPQELAILLQAFNKIATAFESCENSSDVGFKSGLLNDILFSLPKLRDPIKGILDNISLKKASEGRKDTMWTDSEKYPTIADLDLVRHSNLPPPISQYALRRPFKLWKLNSKMSSNQVGGHLTYNFQR
jgi:hypothetical protein